MLENFHDLSLFMQRHDLGLKRKSVALVPYSVHWAAAFIQLERLCHNISEKFECQHVGSTALPGCVAKPILDIVIQTDDLALFSQLESGLTHFGFLSKGEYGIPGRRYFSLRDETEAFELVHIHGFIVGHKNAEDMIFFRNQLLASESLLSEYKMLKSTLLENGLSRKDYTAAKSEFVARVLG